MRIKNKQMLTDHGDREGRRIVAELLDAGLDAIDPYYQVKELVHLEEGRIVLHTEGFEMRDDPHAGPLSFDLKDFDRVYVIGAAKGVQRAAVAFEEVLGDVLTGGHVIAKHGDGVQCKKIGVTLAGHPVPDSFCVEGCKKIEALAADLTKRDLVFTIFGSGCSSLMTYPSGKITVEEVTAFTHMMQIEKGVPTSDLNKVRTHIDRFKGGRLSRVFRNATMVHLVTADPSKKTEPVLRNNYWDMLRENFFPPISYPCSYAEAIQAIQKWDAWEETPASIREWLLSGSAETENVSCEEYETFGARFFGLIFKDTTIYPALRRRARELGYSCLMYSEYMEAEAREAGRVDASIAMTAQRLGEPFKAPLVLMSSGENVVTVGSETGVGGRNQEYCLAAALRIAGTEGIVFGAVDTDGTDGPGGLDLPGAPGCLAGAIVDGKTAAEARNAGFDLWDALKTHGTSEPLWKLGCGVEAEHCVSALDLRIILLM